MRFLSTLILAGLLALGAGAWWFQANRAQAPAASTPAPPTVNPAELTRVEIAPDVVLVRQGDYWNLPGDWPTRQNEVKPIIDALTTLSSRFAPSTINDPKDFGFDESQKPVRVKLVISPVDQRSIELTFGEDRATEGNPFVRPTWMRVGGEDVAWRLAPGLIQTLRKKPDDLLRRQLFPNVVRVKLTEDRPAFGVDDLPPAPVSLADARQITVAGTLGVQWTLERSKPNLPESAGDDPVRSLTPEKLASRWRIEPVADHVDPDKLRDVLATIPDLWVEKFFADVDPAKTGLDKPRWTLAVRENDRELTLLIGNESRTRTIKPPSPAAPPSPMAPPPEPVVEKYSYAKLPNNPRVFEVRTDLLEKKLSPLAELRDPYVARFRPGDATKVQLSLGDRKLTFVREKVGGDVNWKIVEPVEAPAETAKVQELLDKASELQARGPDVIDTENITPYGFAAAQGGDNLTITLAEESPGATTDAPKSSRERTIVLALGKTDPVKKKVYVKSSDARRVSAVPVDIAKLVERPVLAYRGRRLIDAAPAQLARLSVERAADNYVLVHADNQWSLEAPAKAKADTAKAATLAADFAKLEAAEFIYFTPTPEELAKCGLDAAKLKATITWKDEAKKPPRTLLIGNPREGRPEVYAKFADSAEVFTLPQSVKDAIDQPSLAFRPLQLWHLTAARVTRIGIERPGESFSLLRDDGFWKIAGPFAATAYLPAVQPILETAASLRADRFEAYQGDLSQYGLNPPALTLRVTLKGDKPDAPTAEKVVLLGKAVADGQPARFAKLPDEPGVFVIGGDSARAIDTPALELLDRKLLSVKPEMIATIKGAGTGGDWSAKRASDQWQIDSLQPPAPGDKSVLDGLAAAWADLRAQRFAAYAPADWAKFGLDKPTATVTVTVQAGTAPITHSVALGGPSDSNPNARYARIDGGPAVAVLPAGVARELSRTALDLVDRGMLKFDPASLTMIRRTGTSGELTIEKKDGVWQITQPTPVPADEPAVAEMIERLAHLRAVRVAALGVKDFKPFGLDAPSATLTLGFTPSNQPRELTLAIGGPATPDGRFARANGETVYVIPDTPADPLASRLTAPPLKFRDRTLARFTDADKVTITRDGRTATFARRDGRWSMTAPIATEAESFDLDSLVVAASGLRVADLVAEKPDDLKPFGLDKPTAELHFFQGDREVLNLLVGSRDAHGRVVVKSAAGDLVGELEPAIAHRVLGEYRLRSIVPNLDVAQAETLIVNAGSGPLIFTKAEDGWHSAKAGQAANVNAIADVLSTLAGLKAERFVADEKADLKLYGLEPARRVIIVRTRAGQTVKLHLGNQEGGGPKVYATLPDTGNGAVVVLSEADTAKLMKPAEEFTKK